jgi:hypothetical protein
MTDEVVWAADAVITMGCGDACVRRLLDDVTRAAPENRSQTRMG